VESIALGAPVVVVSAIEDRDFDALEAWLAPGHTLALLGSSGVGKSTLINRLLGVERQLTSAISGAVGKGRHTTTRRELLIAPSGALIIDTPGMRELQLWDTSASAIDTTFADVAAIATRCRFSDCSHRTEPGCAILAALDDGVLPLDRWQSFQKLQREQAHANRKANPSLERATKTEWKKLNRSLRQNVRFKESGYD
jgi:ribosome biogenesis GTPase